jgi:hypothetical protein
MNTVDFDLQTARVLDQMGVYRTWVWGSQFRSDTVAGLSY